MALAKMHFFFLLSILLLIFRNGNQNEWVRERARNLALQFVWTCSNRKVCGYDRNWIFFFCKLLSTLMDDRLNFCFGEFCKHLWRRRLCKIRFAFQVVHNPFAQTGNPKLQLIIPISRFRLEPLRGRAPTAASFQTLRDRWRWQKKMRNSRHLSLLF